MDKFSSNSYCVGMSVLLAVLLIIVPHWCECDVLQDVCPEGRSVLITNQTEGVNPSYDGGDIEHWFTIARDFVNMVKNENLPYDVLEDAIESAGLPCIVETIPDEECINQTSSSFKIGKTFSNFLTWWTPILIVSCVGVAVGVVFLVWGCIFWFRCCGKCGGKYSMRQSHDYAMWSCSILLLLCTFGLLAGAVLTFYSNQQAFDSLDSIRVSVNTATDYGVEFTEDLINDGISLFCLVVDVVELSLEQLEDIASALNVVLSNISSDVEEFLQLLEQNVEAIEAIEDTLNSLSTSTIDLKSRQRYIETALVNVTNLATSILETCESNSDIDCKGLPHPSIFVTTANYSMLPDIMPNVSARVNQTLNDVDFEQEANQGRNNFSECMDMIQQNITIHVNESEMELGRLNDTVIEQKDNITNSTREIIRRDVDECSDFNSIVGGYDEGEVDLTAGYIQHCIVDQGFEQIQQYDLYRYSFGVCVCCLSVVIVVLVLMGLVLGVVGWRPTKQPVDRTAISHCGGRFLLIAVGLAYLFGCLVMVMSAFGFFFGSNAQKVCQSLEGPEYEGFTKVLDNEELWGGSLLGSVVFNDPQKTLSFSQLLRNCENDYPLYKAMNLSFLFDIRTDIINFTSVTENLSDEIQAAVESIQLTSDSFFSSSALQAISELNDIISTIDIESFQEHLNDDTQTTLGFNVDEVVHNLTVYRNAITNDTIRQQLISEIKNVATFAKETETQAQSLLNNVTVLHTVLTTTSALVEQATDIIAYITGDGLAIILNESSLDAITAIAGYIDDFILDLADGLDNSIGRCRPLWGIYTELYISVCYDVVDGLNGFWLSLGMCGLFFIPVIILSIITSTCYMRQKNNTAAYFMDDPYSDYLMDNSSKRNSSVSMKDHYNSPPLEDQV